MMLKPHERALTDGQMDTLVNELMGTAGPLSDAVESLFDLSEDELTLADHMELDLGVFLCDECGWWCDVSEQNEAPDEVTQLCDDCNEDGGIVARHIRVSGCLGLRHRETVR